MKSWVKKYSPKLNEIVGQDFVISTIKNFVKDYKNQKKKAILLYGPSGCGKTSMVQALADDFNFELVDINASDCRTKDKINEKVGQAIKQRSLFGNEKLILFDEVDSIGSKDRGGIVAIADLIKNSSYPIIMTANDPFNKKFKPLKKIAMYVECAMLDYNDVFNFLKNICIKELIEYEDIALRDLARRSGGDLRAAINDLQTLAQKDKVLNRKSLEMLQDRQRIDTIQNALIRIFKSSDPIIAVSALDNVSEDIDKSFMFIQNNLPKEYINPEDLAAAYDYLSKADVFKGRIRRWQYWRFLVYVNAFMTAGVAVSKKEKYKKMVEYTESKRGLQIWMANMKYQKRMGIAQKIAEYTHTSTKRVINDVLPYLQTIFKNNPGKADIIAKELDLDPDEIKWLK